MSESWDWSWERRYVPLEELQKQFPGVDEVLDSRGLTDKLSPRSFADDPAFVEELAWRAAACRAWVGHG